MKQHVSIGVVCLARKTFDYQAGAEIFLRIQAQLKTIENIEWHIIPELVIEIEDAQKAALMLASRQIDALICISGTFHLGHLILELNKVIQRPILLWGLDELPYNGGKIRLNSVCGVNLNASNLYKAGVRNFQYIIGEKVDIDWIDAIRVVKAFATAHIGLVGYRAHGFFNLEVDELDLYHQTGVLVDHYEIQDVIAAEIDEKEIPNRIQMIKEVFDISGINQGQLENVAKLVLKFDAFLKKNRLTAIAVRCWPEFAATYGIAPCAAMSILQSEGKILACEGDLLGSMSMLGHQAIGAETPFLADFSQVNLKENFALLWHCGVAPCNLWDGKCKRSLDTYFAGGKGVTADFVMKSGPISIFRIDFASSEHRILLQTATGQPMTKDLKGTYVKTTFPEQIAQVLHKIVQNGIAHHVSVVYGEYIKPLEIFAKIKGWKIIQ